MTTGLHCNHAKQTERARGQFREFYGTQREAIRAAEIDAFPSVEWKGKRLRTFRCHGIRGKGPHAVNVPESLLWALIDLRMWCCPFHTGDAAPVADARELAVAP